MGEVGHQFVTRLTVEECKSAFRSGATSSRGAMAKIGGLAAKLKGNDKGGFFTPEFNSPFGFGEDGPPSFTVGVWIERFSGGAQGAGYCVQMHVWDKGEIRQVELVAPHGVTEVLKPKQLVKKFTESFRELDPTIPSFQ